MSNALTLREMFNGRNDLIMQGIHINSRTASVGEWPNTHVLFLNQQMLGGGITGSIYKKNVFASDQPQRSFRPIKFSDTE